jgi:hypothetical protein
LGQAGPAAAAAATGAAAATLIDSTLPAACLLDTTTNGGTRLLSPHQLSGASSLWYHLHKQLSLGAAPRSHEHTPAAMCYSNKKQQLTGMGFVKRG